MVLVPILAGVVLILVVVAAHVLLPSAQGGKSAVALAEEVARARTLAFASLAAALGAIGAYYSHKTFALNAEGHITDRFMRAVEQLSSTSREVRVGGIYALERVSRDSWEDHGAIVDVLVAFLREQARSPTTNGRDVKPDHLSDGDREQPEADVLAAITVLEMPHLAHVERPPWYRVLADTHSA